MFTARIENKYGESLTLSGNEDLWQIERIEGLGPVPAQLNITSLAGLDGGRFNSSQLNTRNIVITLALKGNVEENRQRLYRFCGTKEKCTFYFSNRNRKVFTTGYVETDDVSLFGLGQRMQISIICPDAYFQSTAGKTQEITGIASLFTFPFSINAGEPVPFSEYAGESGISVMNTSDAETGAVIKIVCISEFLTFAITNVTKEETMIFTYGFLPGDVITIDTNRGQKSVRLLRGGQVINFFSALDITASKFIQLAAGQNYFTFTVDGERNTTKAKVSISFNEKYRGV